MAICSLNPPGNLAIVSNKLVLILIAIFLPPVAVVLKRGFGMDLLINILLCLLVFFPGMVHALWVVSKVDAP